MGLYLMRKALALHAIQGFPGSHLLCLHIDDLIPKTLTKVHIALIELGNVTEQLVRLIVLGVNSAGPRLEAHVDIFGYQDQTVLWMLLMQLSDSVENFVVVEMRGQHRLDLRSLCHQYRQLTRRW